MAPLVDPLDTTVIQDGWMCTNCGVEVSRENTYCRLCLCSRPMDKHGVPQIFAGCKIHFNGVIPRTLKHPSHSVEWRMAERHGAICFPQLDLTQVNFLVYRPGYERSDKVRKVLTGEKSDIAAVSITWMLDSLLQSRKIHPAFYRLTSIPATAEPTGRGSVLPHHQHPYFLMNVEEYIIPTSFPPDRVTKKDASRAQCVRGMAMETGMDLPPFFDLPELRYTTADVFQMVCNMNTGAGVVAEDQENDEEDRETRKRVANIELFCSEHQRNCVDNLLFSGMNFLLTPSLETDRRITHSLEMCGGKIIYSGQGSVDTLLRTCVTHVLYDYSEKKCGVMIEAANAKKMVPGLTLAQISWAEDCLMLGELIPACGPYVPTQKLMETLLKKYSRR